MKKFIWCIVAAVAVLAACSEQKQGTKGNPYYPEDVDEDTAYVTLEEAAGDSMLVGSSAYSQVERELEVMAYQAEEIKSTYMLQLMLGTYEQDMKRAADMVKKAEDSGQCNDDELKTLHDTYDYIEAVIAEKRQKFSLPAAGIIGALHTTSKVLNKVRTREELDRVLSARPGYFETLPSLHLIVQEPSQQREVHRLAKELQRTLERKKAELR